MVPATKIENGTQGITSEHFGGFHFPKEASSESSNEPSSEEESGSTDCGSPKPIQVMRQKKRHRRPLPYSRPSRDSSPESVASTSGGLESFEQLNLTNDDPLEVEALALMTKIRNYIVRILSVEEYKTFECYSDAKRLANVSIVMTKSLQLGNFLSMFSHSVSCRNANCSTSCRMLRRVRSHVINGTHSCALMHVYGQLLRLHVDTCHQEDGLCGMKSCKGMRDMRKAQGNQVLPPFFRENELLIAKTMSKRNKMSKSESGETSQEDTALDLSMSQSLVKQTEE